MLYSMASVLESLADVILGSAQSDSSSQDPVTLTAKGALLHSNGTLHSSSSDNGLNSPPLVPSVAPGLTDNQLVDAALEAVRNSAADEPADDTDLMSGVSHLLDLIRHPAGSGLDDSLANDDASLSTSVTKSKRGRKRALSVSSKSKSSQVVPKAQSRKLIAANGLKKSKRSASKKKSDSPAKPKPKPAKPTTASRSRKQLWERKRAKSASASNSASLATASHSSKEAKPIPEQISSAAETEPEEEEEEEEEEKKQDELSDSEYLPVVDKSTVPKNSRRRLQFSQVQVLEAWLTKHASCPYPTREQKEMLARRCNLEFSQVYWWFSNRRKTARKRNDVSTRTSRAPVEEDDAKDAEYRPPYEPSKRQPRRARRSKRIA